MHQDTKSMHSAPIIESWYYHDDTWNSPQWFLHKPHDSTLHLQQDLTFISVTRLFTSGFFHEQSSFNILLAPFPIFLKFSKIFATQDPLHEKMDNICKLIFFIFCLITLSARFLFVNVHLRSWQSNIVFIDTSGKFIARVIDACGKFKGAQAWDIRCQDFCSNLTYMDRLLRN